MNDRPLCRLLSCSVRKMPKHQSAKAARLDQGPDAGELDETRHRSTLTVLGDIRPFQNQPRRQPAGIDIHHCHGQSPRRQKGAISRS